MPHIDILVLAIVQGVTEFLPVGASGHIIWLSDVFCWATTNPLVNLGTDLGLFLALALYFWRDVLSLIHGLIKVLKRKRDPRSRLLGFLLLAGLPSAAISLILQILFGDSLASLGLIAAMLIIFALPLYVADSLGLTVRRMEHLTAGGAFLIGLAQCLDVMPGVSRVGIAFTVSRFLGFERMEAARFSLLLGIPNGLVLILYRAYLIAVDPAPLVWPSAILALLCSAIAGFLAISFLMYWLRRASVVPFVLYRLALGLYLFYLLHQLPGIGC